MENASKALIIAGAILLSILIIGLGMFIYGQAKDAIGNTGLDQAKIDNYNAEFLYYEGTQSGAQVKQLISTIASHNRTNVDDASFQIGVTVDGQGTPKNEADGTEVPSDTVLNLRKKVMAGLTYTVTPKYDPKSGYICCIDITKKN